MRRAVLFLIVTFAIYAGAQSRGSSGGAVAAGAPAAGGTMGSISPTISPGLSGQPTSGPAAEAPTSNLGPSTTQPLGTGEFTNGSAASGLINQNGFATAGAVGYGYGYGGYVPMLQTPEVSFPAGVTNIPNNPAGISNMTSAAQYSASLAAAAPAGHGGTFNLGAANPALTSGMSPNKSLGEVAREFRAQEATQHASRLYTNADIARLNENNNQVPLGSNLGPQSNARSTNPAPPSPTTPAVNNQPPQPGQNQNLPGSEGQPPQPR